ncbi:nucleoside triphosphate pyrophosphohydrolase family protein [Varibaculum cambriense]|uniref:nucleoside triphosphate pyrophosphohydrolase family protein n=1 Tax=Varibaculum cambriense TaxID=184870 RepID=UPI00290135B8|nr:nucleoside triphosphate pyrophosphohydrolase family protein [Varibaculum cambriense]MDU1224488.1 nucleoside triphosphate pyrophosphohydrolase family protein [Varibaculum cambriense]MDU3274903.1 nucleoside triphosphate pyrophosphohydrolase family protein [Varibaculum cambriense]
MNEAGEAQQTNNLQSEHQIPDPHRPEDLVRQFHQVYGLPIKHDQPEVNRERIHMRMRLIYEEVSELTGAVYGAEARRLLEKTISSLPDDGTRDTIETADALADLIYVIYGMALECGISLPAVLREVQASNLSKLDGEGKPIYREDGKVLKGENFFPPNIKSALKTRIPE